MGNARSNAGLDADRQKISLLQRILAALEREGEGAASLHTSTDRLVERVVEMTQRDEALRWMVAASLPSTPAASQEVVVDTLGVVLYENQGDPLVRITVDNDDLAQSIWVGPQGVGINTGARIRNVDWRAFVMPSGSVLWGITDVGMVSARVSIGQNIKRHLDSILRELL